MTREQGRSLFDISNTARHGDALMESKPKYNAVAVRRVFEDL